MEQPRPSGERRPSQVDNDQDLWHNREAASQLVARYSKTNEDRASAGSGQGTLMGVIFPCMANILGVLLFLRLPWIVGKAGILNGFLLVFVCCLCTFLTTLSLSAVATNGKILGGGAYFLISRSLGPALGAGVGLCFYMANSIGAAMYFMGTVEAWEIAAPDLQILKAGELNNIRVTGFCILAVALVVVGGGIKTVAKLGTVFLFIVLFVILCMYLGCFVGPVNGEDYLLEVITKNGTKYDHEFTWNGLSAEYFSDNFGSAYDAEQLAFPLDESQYGFVSLMALWFPAVTGIMAGSNRSADLKDPAGSIPKGTLFAQGFTSFIYLSFVVLYGSIAPRETLLGDKFFASSSAWPFKEVVLYGVMASTIGAGLTSLVSGTRLLSAIASDKTLPILKVFAVKPGKEPRLALVASGVLCAVAISIGELNAVAPVLTMFFLMCYTCVNMSCTILEAVHDPNWRPRFKYHHWSISLIGAILCIWMMFAISAIIAMIAIVFCSVIFVYAAYNSHEVKWGDGFQGMKFQLARNILTHMDLTAHTKNWRPQLLVITGASVKYVEQTDTEKLVVDDPLLLNLASQLKGGRGLTILGGICGTSKNPFTSDSEQKVLDGQDAIKLLLQQYSISGFGRVVYTPDYSHGVDVLVQISGLGAFQPNCVLATWPNNWTAAGKEGQEIRSRMIRLVQVAVTFNKVVLLSKGATWPELNDRVTGTIDIWWIVGDGGILLLLPFLMTKHRVWAQCRIRLFVLALAFRDDKDKIQVETETYVRDFRLNIEVHVVVVDDEAFPPAAAEELQPSPRQPGSVPPAAPPSVPTTATPPPSSATSEKQPFTVTHASGIDIEVPHGRAASLACGAEHGILADLIAGTASAPPKSGNKPQGLTLLDDLAGHLQKGAGDDAEAPPRREISTNSFTERISRWREEETQRQISRDGDMPMSRQISPRTPLSGRHEFPFAPPGTKHGARDVDSEATSSLQGASDLPFRAGSPPANSEDPVRVHSLNRLQSKPSARDFMSNMNQLTSNAPCSADEMSIASGLNQLMVSKSMNADLIVTNLPDLPMKESAYGYFQLVEAMTANLKRVILVRGTTTEVITAFT